jgi:hypothetical protein
VVQAVQAEVLVLLILVVVKSVALEQAVKEAQVVVHLQALAVAEVVQVMLEMLL